MPIDKETLKRYQTRVRQVAEYLQQAVEPPLPKMGTVTPSKKQGVMSSAFDSLSSESPKDVLGKAKDDLDTIVDDMVSELNSN